MWFVSVYQSRTGRSHVQTQSNPHFPATGCSQALLTRWNIWRLQASVRMDRLLQNTETVGRACHYCTDCAVIRRQLLKHLKVASSCFFFLTPGNEGNIPSRRKSFLSNRGDSGKFAAAQGCRRTSAEKSLNLLLQRYSTFFSSPNLCTLTTIQSLSPSCLNNSASIYHRRDQWFSSSSSAEQKWLCATNASEACKPKLKAVATSQQNQWLWEALNACIVRKINRHLEFFLTMKAVGRVAGSYTF